MDITNNTRTNQRHPTLLLVIDDIALLSDVIKQNAQTIAKPACVLAPSTPQTEPDFAFCAASSAAKQVTVNAGLASALIHNRF